MADEEQTAPAGTEYIDTAAAAALLNDLEREKPAQATKPAQEPAAQETTEPEQAAAEEAPQESETPQDAAEEAEPAQEAESPEPESYDLDKIHGNTKIRLRDGSEWTAGELKRRISEVQDVEKTQAQFAQERQAFEQARAQIAQQAQLFAQMAPQAIAAIQQSLPQVPPLPPQELANTDPFAYSEQLAKHLGAKQQYDAKVAQMQQLQQAAYHEAVRRQQEGAQRLAQAVQTERQKLLEKFPEFADSGKARAFQSDFLKYGKQYGFSEKELSEVYDHRLIGVMRDASAYRKLQENRPKPVQPKQAPAPVQQPGRRASNAEVKATQRQELFQRAKQSGSIEDVADVIAKLGI